VFFASSDWPHRTGSVYWPAALVCWHFCGIVQKMNNRGENHGATFIDYRGPVAALADSTDLPGPMWGPAATGKPGGCQNQARIGDWYTVWVLLGGRRCHTRSHRLLPASNGSPCTGAAKYRSHGPHDLDRPGFVPRACVGRTFCFFRNGSRAEFRCWGGLTV